MSLTQFETLRNMLGISSNDNADKIKSKIRSINLRKGWRTKAKVPAWGVYSEISQGTTITSRYRFLRATCQASHADLKNTTSGIKSFFGFGVTAQFYNLVCKILPKLDEGTSSNLNGAYDNFLKEAKPLATKLKNQHRKVTNSSGKVHHISNYSSEGELLSCLLAKLEAEKNNDTQTDESENDGKSKKGKHKFWNKFKEKNKENDEDDMDDNEDDDNENEDDDEDDGDGPGGKGKAKRGSKGKSKNENDNDDDDDDEDDEDDDEDEKDKSKKIGKDKGKDKKDDDADLDIPNSKNSGVELHDEKVDSTATSNKLGATSSGESPHVDVNSDNSSETDDLNKDSANTQSIGSPMQNPVQEGNIPQETSASGNLGTNPQVSLPNQQTNSSNNSQQQMGTAQNQQQNMNGSNQFAGQSYSGPYAAPNNSLGSRPMRLGPELFGNNDGNNQYQEPNNTYAYGGNSQNSNNNQSPNNGYQQQNAGYSYNNGQNQNNNSYQYQNSSPYVYGSNQNANNAQFVNQSYSGQNTNVNNSLGSRPMKLDATLDGNNSGNNYYQNQNNNFYDYENNQNWNNNQFQNNGYQDPNVGAPYYNNDQGQNNNGYQWGNSNFNSHYNGQNPDFDSKNMSSESDDDDGLHKIETFGR